jgi:nucleoside 2-deoxyribosyltransferase
MIKVIYIAGPYRAKNAWDREENIRNAERLALEVWRLGHAALCPHTNNRFFDGILPDRVFLEGDLALLHRCDAVLLTSNWRKSRGAREEREIAIDQGIPVFESLEDFCEWCNKPNFQ